MGRELTSLLPVIRKHSFQADGVPSVNPRTRNKAFKRQNRRVPGWLSGLKDRIGEHFQALQMGGGF